MVDRLGASFLSLKNMLLGPAVCVQGPTCSLGSDLGRWAHNNSSWFLGSLTKQFWRLLESHTHNVWWSTTTEVGMKNMYLISSKYISMHLPCPPTNIDI